MMISKYNLGNLIVQTSQTFLSSIHFTVTITRISKHKTYLNPLKQKLVHSDYADVVYISFPYILLFSKCSVCAINKWALAVIPFWDSVIILFTFRKHQTFIYITVYRHFYYTSPIFVSYFWSHVFSDVIVLSNNFQASGKLKENNVYTSRFSNVLVWSTALFIIYSL